MADRKTTNPIAPMRILAFGGCMVNNPLLAMMRERQVEPWQRRLGFTRTPYAFSSLGVRQLLEVFEGKEPVPTRLWPYCYMGVRHAPTDEEREYLSALDCVIVELSTLAEHYVGSTIINGNRINDLALKIAAHPGVPMGAAQVWLDKLGSREPVERRDAALAILKVYPNETSEHAAERQIISELRVKVCRLTDIEETFAALRDRFAPARVVICLFHYCYMSGARAIDWPPELNKHAIAAARRLGLAIFDPAVLVKKHGNETALSEDQRHWAQPFNPIVGAEIVDFVRKHNARRLS